tara:strand:+ start:112 stop:1515 length:1404 start_codon:yes stop_codon:yes gene_type:complete
MALLLGLAVVGLGAFSDWSVSAGMNACSTPTKGGPCGGDAKDHPGFHYVGVLNSTDACSATCEATGTNCTIWLYSTSSKHCWWRLDGVWDPVGAATITSGCRSTSSVGVPCVQGCGACPVAPTPPPTAMPPVESGTAPFRYRYEPSKLLLPPTVQLLHGHGVTKDSKGNIYATYVPSLSSQKLPTARCLIRYAPDGTNGVLLGNWTLAQGKPHGIKVELEADGKEYLYHANTAATVTKTTLDGEIIWRSNMTAEWENEKAHWPFKPTDVMIPPTEPNTVLVADGYGRSQIHAFDRVTGKYTGVVFGGRGNESTPGKPAKFEINHGMSLDHRNGKIVVSDRSNHRLVWIEDDGMIIKVQNVVTSEPLPCNAQTSKGSTLGDDLLVVAGLGVDHADPGPYLNGSVSIFHSNQTLVSTIEVAQYLGVGVLGHTHPHDAIFLPNGDIVVAIWKGHEAGSLGGFEYWTHLKE